MTHRLFLLAVLLCGLAFGAPAQAKDADFVFVDLGAHTLRAEDMRGKWVLVNFWAPWCPPCWSELPELDRLAAENKNLVVIAVAMDYGGNVGAVRGWAERLKLKVPVVLGGASGDPRNAAQQIGEVGMFPTTYLYGPDGRQVAVYNGPVRREEILRVLGRGQANS